MNGLLSTCSYHCVGLVSTFFQNLDFGETLALCALYRKQEVPKGHTVATGQL